MGARCLLCAGVALLVSGCASDPDRRTLAELARVEPDLRDENLEGGLQTAMQAYRRFLAEAPESRLTPEAMRRLADLQLEKDFGLLAEGEIDEVQPASGDAAELPGPREAIALYDQILASYPEYEHSDQVLYQKARAYDELGRPDEAIEVIEDLTERHGESRFTDEVQFRRAEYFFMRKQFLAAEEAYAKIVANGPARGEEARSEFYELALYKLGWALYKQELHEEALQQYLALLDYKTGLGYDFDTPVDEADERRIADTFRVISLSFSNLGGADAVTAYFGMHGARAYEHRIYAHLAEFYFEKLRYADAAGAYQRFVDQQPLHAVAPRFGMRIVEIYEAGGFPQLVLEAKKSFASTYGPDAEYWKHFELAAFPEAVAYLKQNLQDLAVHYHAAYQEGDDESVRAEAFDEALGWYRAYLASFSQAEEAPGVHYRLADLLLEGEDFPAAAREYEACAYQYAAHDPAAGAGYAAIFAHREHEKRTQDEARDAVRRAAVDSTLRFVERFGQDERAASVLGAAVDDLYALGEYPRAIEQARALLTRYAEAPAEIRRAAWASLAHSSFETEAFAEAEAGYAEVLELMASEDEARDAAFDNLAAAIYKQGELARAASEHDAAAAHFLRVRDRAPDSKLRPAAEYDAASAFVALDRSDEAVEVLEAFRTSFPAHELHAQAGRQIAFLRREQGKFAAAATEYARVAEESEDLAVQREALLLAGELHRKASQPEAALAAYRAYLVRFAEPLEVAVETRSSVAALCEELGDGEARRRELRRIVEIDAEAAAEVRSDRMRLLAARAALVLAQDLIETFEGVALVQPFESALRDKRVRMSAATQRLNALLDYEVAEITAAATFHLAGVYDHFSEALMRSERPAGMSEAERFEYDDAIEEQAFPFEERAIALHQKNHELMRGGVYNAWVARSLAVLAEKVPGRYARTEQSGGWLVSAEDYRWDAPRAPQALPASPASAIGPAAPAAPSAPSEDPQTLEPSANEAGGQP